MSLEERIAKLKTSLAEKFSDDRTNFMQRHSERVMWRDAHKNTFLAGTDALAEVYRLQGRIEAYREAVAYEKRTSPENITRTQFHIQMNLLGPLEAQLEALLKQMEEKV